MADPLSIVAIVGLAFAGRSLSQKNNNVQGLPKKKDPDQSVVLYADRPMPDAPKDFLNKKTELFENAPQQKEELSNFSDIVPNMNVNGSPVNDLRNRPYVSGKMNNIGPVARELVGPGIGIGPNVPAYGGYQQLYQVLPTNVGAYKLTTLPGRSGPAFDVSGGRAGIVGQLTHDAPAKTAFLPSRRPPAPNRAQGQGGALTSVVARGEYEKTKRTTNRSETGLRDDGLGYAPAKRFTSALAVDENPTRNKGDETVGQYNHVDNPTPGIHSFVSGVTNTPIVKMMEARPNSAPSGYSTQQLVQSGLRPVDRRGQNNRSANPGRMNVRESALKQGGMVTAVRSDTNKYDGRVNAANGGWTQNYVNDSFYQFNAYKGNYNDRASNKNLNMTKNVLANNPLNHSLS